MESTQVRAVRAEPGPFGFGLVEFAEHEFTMGSAEGVFRAAPLHTVRLSTFLLGDRCVSAADVARFLQDAPGSVDHLMIDSIDPGFVVHGRNGFGLRPGCGGFPMIQISFWGAAAYCNWLSDVHGLPRVYDVAAGTADASRPGFRLPTEAEWEAAARAGRGGVADPARHNTLDAEAGVAAQRAGRTLAGMFDVGTGPVPVTALQADAAGLHHMLGNVREWCHDLFGPYRDTPAR